MKQEIITIQGIQVRLYSLNTVIVGSGAAGFNAAACLQNNSVEDIAIVTEGRMSGTSRNTGSDKQTYYKLTLAGTEGDSVREMAETLFRGGAMHGDIALTEAAMSARCFHRLAALGVPFPHNRFGEYIGYKTDHDPRQRATSAGPYTSRYMTECLEREVRDKNIAIFDGFRVIGILTDDAKTRTLGLIALDLNGLDCPETRYVVFNCTNIVYAVGGPAGMYSASVYPGSQTGATGTALEAGAEAVNLTESQFGIASTQFRWNLSGSYQQVLPRYISTDHEGGDEREFLNDWIDNPGALLDAVFLKGYQWPFDPGKIRGGSSMIDILVYHERELKGRRVFLDFRRNPSALMDGDDADFSRLGDEAFRYLEQSGLLFGTPVERLRKMNDPAYELYREHGIDLEREPLEIAVCNQHNNGGLAGNVWWESNLAHFFPVGEVNGSHGIHRPGGSALNSGQVGSTRAALYISKRYNDGPAAADVFLESCGQQIENRIGMGESIASTAGSGATTADQRRELQRRMDRAGGIIRSRESADEARNAALEVLERFRDTTGISSIYELPDAFINYDLLVAQYVYLTVIADYCGQGGKSRGSYLVHDSEAALPHGSLPDMFRFSLDEGCLSDSVQTLRYRDGVCDIRWDDVRPIPESGGWFETVWNDFMNDRIVK